MNDFDPEKEKSIVDQDKYHLFVDNSTDAIFLTSPDGKVYNCNPAASTLFGYSEKEFQSVGRDAILDKSDPSIPTALDYREKTGLYSGVLNFKRKDGSNFQAKVNSNYFRMKDGSLRTLTIVHDLSAYNKAEEIISIQNQVFDSVSDALYTFNSKLIITSWNKAAERLYGWKADEIIGKYSIVILRAESSVRELREKMKMIDERGELLTESIHYTKENKKIYVESNLRSLKDSFDNIIGYLTSNRDITNRKKMEEHIRNERSRLEILTDLVDVFAKATYNYSLAMDYTVKKLACDLRDHCVIRLLNEKGDRLIEKAFYHREKECLDFLSLMYAENVFLVEESYSGESLKTRNPVFIPVQTDYSRVKKEYRSYAEKFGMSSVLIVPIETEGELIGTISMFRNKPGDPYTIDDQLFLQNVAGKVGFAITKARLFNHQLCEIWERKINEEKISTALNEKEVLLKELYHRTKNNMQVIYSLLNIKAGTLEDEKTKIILEDMGNRIKSMALVHQKLYQSRDLTRIDLKGYINDLANLLIESFCAAERNIRIKSELESVFVNIDTAISCGLIINELISNSFKYAFPQEGGGEIIIRLSQDSCEIIKLSVSDNGVGISENKEITNEGTLGMQLIKSIVENQLQGEVSYCTNEGVSFTIKFKEIVHE